MKERLRSPSGRVTLLLVIVVVALIGLVFQQVPVSNFRFGSDSTDERTTSTEYDYGSTAADEDQEYKEDEANEERHESKFHKEKSIKLLEVDLEEGGGLEKNLEEGGGLEKDSENDSEKDLEKDSEKDLEKDSEKDLKEVDTKNKKGASNKSLDELLDEVDDENLKFFANSVIDGGYRVGLYAGWRDFCFRMRTYKRLFWMYDRLITEDKLDLGKFGLERKKYYNNETQDNEAIGTVTDRMLWRLEKQLFPWAHVRYHSLLEMWKSQKSSGMRRGIVICVYENYVRIANTLLYNIRKVHKSNIPIAIAHSGDELSEIAISMFQRKYQTIDLNLDEYVDSAMLGGLRGFQIKGYALLMAPFVETMLVDADATFIQPPEVIFEETGYKTDGTVFFTDRTGLTGQYPPRRIWVDNNIPHPISDKVKGLRWYNEKSSYEVESGVVLVDKSKRLAGVLAATLLMAKEEREEIFRVGYGDKEAFWQAFEMAGEPFYIRPDPPGCIGRKRDSKTACNCHILHVDPQKKPLWFNGGIQQTKAEPSSGVVQHSHYGFEGRWDWSREDCVSGGDIFEFTSEEKRVVDATWEAYDPNPLKDFLAGELAGVAWN